MENKIASIQGLRGIAFTMIFLSHAMWKFGQLGYFGVSLFIIMSGALMTRSYYHRSIEEGHNTTWNLKFAIRKISKLYPLHIFTMLCFLLLSLIHVTDIISIAIDVVCNFFLIQSWIPCNEINVSLNGVAWYLSTCMAFYYFFPYLLRHIKQYRNRFQAIRDAVLTWCLQVFALLCIHIICGGGRTYDWFSYVFPLFRLGDFFIGCILGYIIFFNYEGENRGTTWIKESVLIVSIPVALWLSESSFGNVFIDVVTTRSIVYTPISVGVLYVILKGSGIFEKICKYTPLVFIGDMSSYGYLLHLVVITYMDIILNHFHVNGITTWIVVIIEYLIVIMLSSLCHYIEKRVSFTKKK